MSTPAERPTGTVTFLFTDIEGSTRLLKELRDDYGTALADHQRIIRAALADHDGAEIDTQGDSFFAAFRRAKDAVGAAVDAQRALAAHDWPNGSSLRVRMGIHTGEPAVGGERYVGLGVHRAARIAAVGHGGQVLVSATTRELVRDDPPPDVSLRDLGEHQLKDMDEPERIYQLLAPGLETDFPPLKTTAPALAAGREGDLVEAAEETVEEMARPWRRHRGLVLGAGAVLALALAGVLAVVLTRGSATASGTVAANDVGVVDAGSGKVSAQISVGRAPTAVAAGEGSIWVTNGDDDSVSLVDPTTNDVRQTIDVGGGPSAVAVGSGSAWVTNGLDGTLSRIATNTDRVTQTITVDNGPAGVAYGAGAVWVASSVEGTVSRIDADTGRVVRTIPVASGVSAVAVGFGRIWVVAPSLSSVLALDPKTGTTVDRIGVGVDPSAIATGAGAVWVTNRSDGTLSRVDPRAHSVTDTIPVGQGPAAVAVGEGGVWVANSGGTLTKVDPSRVRVQKTVTLSNAPRGLTVAANNVYVAVRSTGRAHRGGVLRVASSFGFDFIDPALGYTPESWSILSMTNDGLVAFRRVGGIQGTELVPDLAASLPQPFNGGKTYTFRLRPDIHYSTGRPVQPEDFRRAIERVYEVKPLSAGTQYYGALIGVAGCKPGRRCDLSRSIVTDRVARTVTFHLTRPDPDFLAKLALTFAAAVPAATPGRDVGTHPVPATGPYMIARAKKGTARLVRNPRFRVWSVDAKPGGYPDVIDWTIAGTDEKLKDDVQAVARGKEDAALGIVPPLLKRELDSLATHYPGQLRMSTAPVTNFFFLNTRVPPFNDVRARLAVNHAFDRQAFAALLGRAFEPACQILPPNYPSFRKTCPYGAGGVAGLDKARSLVRASGTAGASVSVWAPGPIAVQARFMVSTLRSIGYRARVHLVPDPRKYFTLVTDSRTHAQTGYYGWASDFPSEQGFLTPILSCAAFVLAQPDVTTNPGGFCRPSIDRQIKRAAAVQAEDPPAARALWRKIEREVLAQAPMVPTYNRKNVDFVAKRVGNYQYHPQWGPLLDQLWVR